MPTETDPFSDTAMFDFGYEAGRSDRNTGAGFSQPDPVEDGMAYTSGYLAGYNMSRFELI